MTKKMIRAAASKAWQVIAKSDTQSHTEPIGNGWSVRAMRMYRHRAYRTAWSPTYGLVAPDGTRPVDGYDSAEGFATYVAFWFRQKGVV